LERTWLGESQFIGYYGIKNYWVFILGFAWDYWGGFRGVGGAGGLQCSKQNSFEN